QRADRRLAAGARSLDEDLDLLQTLLDALAGGGVGGHLGGERSGLARALEAGAAGGLPRDHVPLAVGQGDDRVVERRLDVSLADRDVLPRAPARATARRLSARRRHVTSWPSTSCRGRRSSSVPCACARSFAFAVRSPAT